MDIKECFNIIIKRIWIIVAITLVTTIGAFVFSKFFITKTYVADISVIVGQDIQGSEISKMNESYGDVMIYRQMVKTYAEFAKSRKVLDDVIVKLKLNMSAGSLKGMISVSPQTDTEFLKIAVRAEEPEKARDIANQIAISLKEKTAQVKNVDNIKILDEVQLPTSPAGPRVMMNVAIAFILGIMISVGIIFLIEYLDNTVKSEEDIEEFLGISVLGNIPLVIEK